MFPSRIFSDIVRQYSMVRRRIPQLRCTLSASIVFFVLLLIFILLLPLPSQSQEIPTAATLSGTVRDSRGKPMSDVTIRLQAKDDTQAQTANTDSKGNYRFQGLNAGEYSLRAEMPGYLNSGIPSIFLEPGKTKILNFTLAPSVPGKTSASAASRPPEFFDQPQFTISGVTDTTNLGGHGSDTVSRTRETLAKDTASLGKISTLPQTANSANNDYGRAYELALADVSAGNYDRAKDEAQSLLAHHDKAELHHLLGDIEEKLGNSLEAVREYQHAAELDPSERYLFDWGSELLVHHAPEPASEVFAEGNRFFPGSERMLIGLGATWFARGSYDQAVQKICEASDLNPHDVVPYLFLGKIQAANNTSSKELFEKLRRFATLHPESAEANYYYAVALWKQRSSSQDPSVTEQIELLLNNAVRLDPRFGPAYLQLGILHFEQKDFPRSISDYQHALQADPEKADPEMADSGIEEAHYRLAQVYRQTGQTDKAKAELHFYDQIAKASAQKAERERHEIQQFVYTLRDQPPAQKP
jgi:tetratricopeptide (TPR) repeat protein